MPPPPPPPRLRRGAAGGDRRGRRRGRRVKISSASSFLGSCAKGREMARKGALRRAGVREAVRGGGFLPGGRRRGSGGEIRGILQFEPIKSTVPRGLSPMRAGRGRKRSLKLVTQSPCHALPNFATIWASTRQVRPKRRGAPARRLGLLHF